MPASRTFLGMGEDDINVHDQWAVESMGACQGRICGAAAQVLYGWTPQPARHLLSPARIATLADAGSEPSQESIPLT